ncbi:MAG: hypothetical protein KDK89_00720, partial [Alphaproteobacteria bacterium]|nr:hypothetical protein [Alphaproteobacteria bacterium]
IRNRGKVSGYTQGHSPERKVIAMAKSMKIGRSAVTGRFVSVKTAQSKSATHVVETIKKSGK